MLLTLLLGQGSGGSTTTINPTKASVSISGKQPTLTQPNSLSPAKASVTFTGKQPTISVASVIQPVKGSLSASGKAPTLTQPNTLSPSKYGALLTGKTPTLTQPRTVSPSKYGALLTGKTPALTQPNSLSPAKASVILSGKVPTVSQSASTTLTPIKGSLSLTGYQPTITQPSSVDLTPVTGHYSITGYIPSVSQSGAPDTRLDQILAILMGVKVYDETTGLWRVFDQDGNELADDSGILMQGLHGFLLRNQEGVTGAAGFTQKKRRKNIVNIDGTLYEFNSEEEAISFINSIDEPKAEESKPEPIREVRISQVETLAKVFTIQDKQTEIYQDIQFANYADILAAYDRLIEIEDEEILLLL